eukprot:3204996-Alexandrium_andersonii.AAC.1
MSTEVGGSLGAQVGCHPRSAHHPLLGATCPLCTVQASTKQAGCSKERLMGRLKLAAHSCPEPEERTALLTLQEEILHLAPIRADSRRRTAAANLNLEGAYPYPGLVSPVGHRPPTTV